MTLKLPEKNLAAIILLTAFLTACGGGGDSDNSANDVTPEPTAPAASPDDTSLISLIMWQATMRHKQH